jgi:carboxyl-terminal processing protease
MTTAKYYTPSGRCIQRMNYSTWTDSSKQAETKAFHTDAGRLVHGGGGIAPDVLVTLPLLTDLAVDLRRKSHFFNFAVSYANTHTALEKDFSITDDIIGDFRTYLKNRGYHYEYPVESGLKKLQEDGQSKGYDPKLLQNINALLASFQTNEDKLFELSREDISQLLQFELTTKFFGVASAVKIGMKTDLVFLAAKNILQDKERYRSILHPEKEIR